LDKREGGQQEKSFYEFDFIPDCWVHLLYFICFIGLDVLICELTSQDTFDQVGNRLNTTYPSSIVVKRAVDNSNRLKKLKDGSNAVIADYTQDDLANIHDRICDMKDYKLLFTNIANVLINFFALAGLVLLPYAIAFVNKDGFLNRGITKLCEIYGMHIVSSIYLIVATLIWILLLNVRRIVLRKSTQI
jgi:hypothetical protein